LGDGRPFTNNRSTAQTGKTHETKMTDLVPGCFAVVGINFLECGCSDIAGYHIRFDMNIQHSPM